MNPLEPVVTAASPPVNIGAYIDPLMKRRVVELARANDRTISAEVRVVLRRHVSHATNSPPR
jgi:hypothetical protein